MNNLDKLISCIRNKEYGYFQNEIKIGDYNWLNTIDFIYKAPKDHLQIYLEEEFCVLYNCQDRPSLPAFSRKILDILNDTLSYGIDSRKTYLDNQMWFSFVDKGGSLKVHADRMDVIYLQAVGSVEWSMWKNKEEKIESRRLYPGDLVYVPRDQHHLSEPYGPRVSFSHGIQGLDPSTYI